MLYFANLFGVSFDLPAGFRSPDDLILRHFNDGADLLSEADSSRLVTLQVPFTDDPGLEPALEFYPVRDPATKAFTAVAATLGFHSETEVPLGERYRLAAKVSANLSGGLGVRLSNDGQFQLSNGLLSGSAQALADSVPLGARLSIEPVDDDPPAPLVQFGAPGGSRFQIGSGALSFGIERQDALDLFFEGELRDGLIELRTEEADSFIATLLPKGGISSSFSLGLGFSNRTGFYFKGSASLSIRAPVHVSLGPVNVNYLGFAVSAIDNHLVLDVTAGLGAKFGPLSVTVDEVGLRAKLATTGRSLGQSRSARPRIRVQAAERRRARDRRRRRQGRRLSLLRSRPRRICRRPRTDPGGLPEPQGNRADHHADARRQQGLLAARPVHCRVRAGIATGVGLQADRGRRSCRAEPNRRSPGAGARASAPAPRGASFSRSIRSPMRRG